MINIAIGKLVGGLDISVLSNVQCSTEMALALLGCRFALNFHAYSSLVSALCNSHMATCLFILQNPEHIIAGYPSEPVLAEAAALASRRFNPFKIDKLLEHLINQVKEGVVEAGYRGELVAKIILLLARDSAVLGDISDSPDTEAKSIINPCTVHRYLNHLCGAKVVNEKLVQKSIAGFQGFLQGLVYFTHFVNVVYTPTLEDMKTFFMRGAAIFCRRMQEGIDCIIPVMLAGDEWSYILVSVKNYCNQSNLAPAHSNAKKAHMQENANHPYLLLFMDVGPQLECKIETPISYSRAHLARKAQSNPSTALPMTLAITGLSAKNYPFLKAYGNLEESLRKLANASVEPLDFIDSLPSWSRVEDKKRDLKRIMFLTYESNDPGPSKPTKKRKRYVD
jgi:hypothetical protein